MTDDSSSSDGTTKDEPKHPAKTLLLLRRLQPPLPLLETSVCMAVWTVSVVYSMYRLYLASMGDQHQIN